MTLQEIGEAFLLARRREGLSQREVSEKTDVSLGSISNIERGKNINLQTFIALAGFYKMKVTLLK